MKLDIFKNIFSKKRLDTEKSGKREFAMAQISRQTSDWLNIVRSVNFDIKQGGKLLRGRARDMANNDPYTKKFLNIVARNIIGANGFTLRVKGGSYQQDDCGNLVFVLDKINNREISDAFWAWGKKNNCTITGTISHRELCQLLVKTVYMDGEIFINHMSGDYNEYGYTQQIITADYLDENYNEVLSNGNTIVMGIEYDKYGKPVRYWFNERLPQDNIYNASLITNKRVPISAENITHLFIVEKADQLRGITQLAPVAIRLRMLMGWDEAAVINARTSASKAGILEPKDSADSSFTGYGKNSQGNVESSIEPNEIFIVPDGYNFRSHTPMYPHAQHGPFNKTMLMSISSGLDVSYPTLASDYENVNYTSSRTALLDERDGWRNRQSWFIEHYLEDTFSKFLKMAVLSGKVNINIKELDKYNQPQFISRSWQWVDPQTEVNSNILALQSYQTTLEQVLSERSMDLEETLEQIAREKELLKKYGLTIDDVKATYKPDPKGVTEPAKETVTEEDEDEIDEDSEAEKWIKLLNTGV